MPSWLVQLLISLALKLGPVALKALLPKVPAWAQVIISELIGAIEGANGQILEAKQVKSIAVRKAKLALKKKEGIGSAPSLKV